MRLPTSLSPLAERNFRFLWTGQAVSAAGDSLSGVAFVFATLEVSHSAGALGAVLGVGTLARALALPAGGVWADRVPRQVVMLGSDWVRAASQGILGALLISGHLQLWHLIAVALVFNGAGGFFQPASSAVVPQLSLIHI